MTVTTNASRLVGYFSAAGLVAAVFSLFSFTRADPDLWGHVRFGLDTLQTWSLPSVDPYSFTQDTPWINHEWLSELQMGLAWAAGGTVGLALLKGLLVFSVFGLVWARLQGADPAARLFVLLALAIGTARMVQTLRPQLWSLLCLVVLLRILTSSHLRSRWWLPVLFAFWANVHGGWFVGLAVLAVWSIVEAWFEPSRRRGLGLLVGLCVLSTLATPYGWQLWDFLARTVRMTRNIGEWQPISTVHPLVWAPWLAAVAGSVWLALRRDTAGLAAAAVLLMLAYASFRVERITPLFVTAAALLVGSRLGQRWPGRIALPDVRRGRQLALMCAAGAVLWTASALLASRTLMCIPVEGEWVPEREVAGRLDAARAGRLVVFFDWGQYALWHWGADVKVSMDGRRETVYSDARIAEHAAILDGAPQGLEALETWRAEYVWLPLRNGVTERWLVDHGYRIEARSDRSYLAVRADLPALAVPSEAAFRRRCFPS